MSDAKVDDTTATTTTSTPSTTTVPSHADLLRRVADLESQVSTLQARNVQTTQRWQDERLQWESQRVDQERVEDDLRRQIDVLAVDHAAAQKTRDQLEASHDELQHLSKLYSEFMAWKHDKLRLEGERDKLKYQNERQTQTIQKLLLLLERRQQRQHAVSKEAAKEKGKEELLLLEDGGNGGNDNETKDNNNNNNNTTFRESSNRVSYDNDNNYDGDDTTTCTISMEQASFVKGVVAEKKLTSKTGFWGNVSSLLSLSQESGDDDGEDGTTDLNALKRLDDQMVRAEQLSSNSTLPRMVMDDDGKNDDDGTNSHDDHEDNNNRIDNNDHIGSRGFGFFQRGILQLHRNEQFDYSKRELYNHPRVSESPQNLQNVLNLM